MFFRITCLALLITLGLYWFSVRLRPKDLGLYQKKMAEGYELRVTRALEIEPAYQKRQKVRKTMWMDNETKVMMIESQDSDLIISQKKDKIEAIEDLHQIYFTVPNEITVKADSGRYTYPLQETLVYENPKGHIIAHNLDFRAKKLVWEKDLLQLIDDVKIEQADDLLLVAKRGKIYLEKMEPTQIVLEEDVQLISSRIQEKETFALAEKLTYCPQNQSFLFSGEKRVLFWQDGFTLSANEVLIHKDQTVEGLGDVHFTFDLEEQTNINQLFNKYL